MCTLASFIVTYHMRMQCYRKVILLAGACRNFIVKLISKFAHEL